MLAACSPADDGNFSQFPGFAEYFAAHPPRPELPDAAEQALLRRHLPRVFIALGEPLPIDFYADYIAQGELRDGAGTVLSTSVTPDILNASRDDPAAVFTHRPPPAGTPARGVVYGRIDSETLELPAPAGPLDLTFLTYNLVYASSGLPAGLPTWLSALVDLGASTRDWHQLDHYISVSLALDGERPIAATFQQHNTRRTFVLGHDLVLPPDGRLPVAVARRSNELFPRPAETTAFRTTDFASPEGMRWLIMGDTPPWLRADDLVEPGREVELELRFLPPADAFYRFEGWLGERRLLPGRDGPPGADYNALPAIKPKGLQMLAGYWREGDADDLARLDAAGARGQETAAFANAQAAPFAEALAAARR